MLLWPPQHHYWLCKHEYCRGTYTRLRTWRLHFYNSLINDFHMQSERYTNINTVPYRSQHSADHANLQDRNMRLSFVILTMLSYLLLMLEGRLCAAACRVWAVEGLCKFPPLSSHTHEARVKTRSRFYNSIKPASPTMCLKLRCIMKRYSKYNGKVNDTCSFSGQVASMAEGHSDEAIFHVACESLIIYYANKK